MDLILFRFIKGGKQMKYILLDTNIVIDMVIDRRKQVSDTVLSNFIKFQPKSLLKNKKNFADFLKKFEIYL